MYPDLKGVEDENIKREIVKRTKKDLPITTVARNIDFEFYWQEKCEMEDEQNDDPKGKELKGKTIKREQHGNSYK